uniref:metal ABC transporter ATP-binding protein n=1 Tax=Alistipes sp. TaxID=1872444 RepID=UPI004056C7DC
MALVSIRNLSVFYDDYCALEGVNLEINEDDFLGIIGPNGGGKTTLIRALLGALPHSGEVVYSPKLCQKSRKPLIGYMPQRSRFDPTFPISIHEVVLSGLQPLKGLGSHYTRAEKARATELIALAGISEVAHRPVGEVSGGQLQRALLCRSIIAEPKLLILDEPTNFVDNRFENELYSLLQELNKEMAIVMVSHDLGTISSVVKEIVCVNHTVHRHHSNTITEEQLSNYGCPIQLISHGHIPHTVLGHHHPEECHCHTTK